MLWKLGSGEIGGKASGLEFFRSKVSLDEWRARFSPHMLQFPDTAVLKTGLFSELVDRGGLLDAVDLDDDEEVKDRFLAAPLPEKLAAALARYAGAKRFPVAVRSSARNEDAQSHPFAGLFSTILLPNVHDDPAVRLRQLERAVRLVYASTYFRNPKRYMRAHGLSIENEKMAIILQELVGNRRGDLFFPHLAGVAQSVNYFPVSYLTPSDGIALLVMGLGKGAVDGMFAMRFCPAFPMVRPQFQQPADILRGHQREVFALDLSRGEDAIRGEDDTLALVPVADLADGDLVPAIASTWAPAEKVLYPGVREGGSVILTFDRLLSSDLFPLPEVLRWLLDRNARWWNLPVDIEFALNFQFGGGRPVGNFSLLQTRPLVYSEAAEEVDLPADVGGGRLVLRCDRAMGNGTLDGIRHIVLAPLVPLSPALSRALAGQVGELAQALTREGRPFLLVGPGRWGTSNPWLGIPVVYAHIEGARAIAEVTWDGLMVEPSQGTHFFFNITAGNVMYFSVDMTKPGSVLSEALLGRPGEAPAGGAAARLVELDRPLRVKVDGRSGRGIVYTD